jgi:hypothetical protein
MYVFSQMLNENGAIKENCSSLVEQASFETKFYAQLHHWQISGGLH